MANLVTVDVDGTLKLGGGTVFTETLEGLEANGDKVVIVSPSISAQAIWDRFERMTAPSEEREKALEAVKEKYPEFQNYIYISDNPGGIDPETGIEYPSDEERARIAGFEYIHPEELKSEKPDEQVERILAKPTKHWYTDSRGRRRKIM